MAKAASPPARAARVVQSVGRRPARTPDADTAKTSSDVEAKSYAGDPNFMASFARGLAVIRAFSQQRTRMSIAQLSLRSGIPRAAVRRVLYTLSRLGYVSSDDGRTYLLRPQILALGYAYLSSAPLAASAQPILDQVSQAVHESCSMAVLDGDDIMYVARSSSSRRIMSIDLGIGSRLPAYCTSMGRVLLAHQSRTELAAYLRRVKPLPLTPRTELSRERLEAILEATRANGYTIVDEELEIGLRSIAVPVVDREGRVAAALNVSAQAARVGIAEMERKFLPPLETAARDLGMVVG